MYEGKWQNYEMCLTFYPYWDLHPIFNIGLMYAYVNYFILTDVRQATAFFL